MTSQRQHGSDWLHLPRAEQLLTTSMVLMRHCVSEKLFSLTRMRFLLLFVVIMICSSSHQEESSPLQNPAEQNHIIVFSQAKMFGSVF